MSTFIFVISRNKSEDCNFITFLLIFAFFNSGSPSLGTPWHSGTHYLTFGCFFTFLLVTSFSFQNSTQGHTWALRSNFITMQHKWSMTPNDHKWSMSSMLWPSNLPKHSHSPSSIWPMVAIHDTIGDTMPESSLWQRETSQDDLSGPIFPLFWKAPPGSPALQQSSFSDRETIA